MYSEVPGFFYNFLKRGTILKSAINNSSANLTFFPVQIIRVRCQEACASVREHRQSDEYGAVEMQLYGLYKVAREGKCEEPKPDTVSKIDTEAGRCGGVRGWSGSLLHSPLFFFVSRSLVHYGR